jgi:3-oxoadipate enol-lactonase
MPRVTLSENSELYYEDDWLGPPWLKPEPALLIHGAGESSAAWFGWVPRMAQQVRLLRPDLPGFGRSPVGDNFEWSVANLAAVLDQLLGRLGIESAHIIGAKLGGAIAMQFAAAYPKRTRTLVVCSGPVSPPELVQASATRSSNWWKESQRQRLGSDASAELIEYWDTLMASADPRGSARRTAGGVRAQSDACAVRCSQSYTRDHHRPQRLATGRISARLPAQDSELTIARFAK